MSPVTPILENKHYAEPSVFTPGNLLREARRQKATPAGNVPRFCVLDPDGDLSRHLKDSGARRSPYWACYHTDLYELELEGGTSYHYLEPARYARISEEAMKIARGAMASLTDVVQGGTWTTDAPFRETQEAIAFAESEHLLAVEMEAAALYALAEAGCYPILCVARVTNAMGQPENDFEKGEQSGNTAFLGLVSTLLKTWAQMKE